MIILSASNIIKTFGIETILDSISFNIDENDRIGLVGANGAGKTTLLKILTQNLSYDSGDLFLSGSVSIGYLEQNSLFDSNQTVYSEMISVFAEVITLEKELRNLEKEITDISSKNESPDKLLKIYAEKIETFKEKNGYGYVSEVKGVLNGLGFSSDYFDQRVSSLSGGEKTRLSLAKILLSKPQLLLLDEPTNHLDMDSLQWLEQYIKTYKGTVLVISHDRYFLDQIVNRIFEIENRHLSVFEGNYSTYLKKKEELKIQQIKSYEKQQKEIKRQEEMIRRFKQHGTEKLAKRARSRENQLSHLDLLEKPETFMDRMNISFKPVHKSGKDVLYAQDLTKSYEGRLLFTNVSFDIKSGEKICMIGPNGVGKTTLLKIVLSKVNPDQGNIRIGHNVRMGYFDQEQKLLSPSNTLIEEIHQLHTHYTETDIRNILGAFLFRGDDPFKEISVLSGGERARLALLKLMLSDSNFLIMDEPTNHLDIESKEVFEKALLNYEGTLLIVSHDRFFLNRIPDRILELTDTGVQEYLGNYDYYIEKKNQLLDEENESEKMEISKTQKKEALKKEKARLLEEKKKKQALKDIETEISIAEQRLKNIQHDMCKEEIYSNMEKSRALNIESLDLNKRLEALYEEWEAMILLLEQE